MRIAAYSKAPVTMSPSHKSTLVSTARYVPLSNRGFLESARIESERLKDPRRMVSARFYAIRRDVARTIRLPPGLLNEDLYLSRLIGSDRIWRSGAVASSCPLNSRPRNRRIPNARK